MDSAPKDFYFDRECSVLSCYKKSVLNLFWMCLLFSWCNTSGRWTCNLLCHYPGGPQTYSCWIGVSSYADSDLAYFGWVQYGYPNNASLFLVLWLLFEWWFSCFIMVLSWYYGSPPMVGVPSVTPLQFRWIITTKAAIRVETGTFWTGTYVDWI